MAGEEPLFNIGAIERVTGVPVATLRAWERRYGFPESARTPGGHRLYSQRDIGRIEWVKEHVGHGMKTSQAILALEHFEEQGGVADIQPALVRIDAYSRPTLDVLSNRLLAALTANDVDSADRMMGEMLAFYSPEDLALSVMLPVLSAIGREWAEGRISVATEHLASAFLRQRLLMWLVTGPPALPVKPVVLACAPGEWHEGGLLMLGMLLRRRGWPVTYLGQAVPLPDLASFVRQSKPSVVVLVAMLEETASALTEWPQYLPEAASAGSPVIGYGGAIYASQPAWREKTEGLFLGDTIEEGLATVEGFLRR
jgi:methanogenic corrinoid protein MtbC1